MKMISLLLNRGKLKVKLDGWKGLIIIFKFLNFFNRNFKNVLAHSNLGRNFRVRPKLRKSVI